jgi:hypothetical protein
MPISYDVAQSVSPFVLFFYIADNKALLSLCHCTCFVWIFVISVGFYSLNILCTGLAEGRIQWQAYVVPEMNFWVT